MSRAVMVMYDSLNRRMLPPYGAENVHAPNFTRLAGRTALFENCYAGSMPCMPARRELHTGRYNFLHRSWGPLEPYDDSMPELLRQNGVHTHLATDHQHYWEDGGATYHNRYSTYEFFRGQEGDRWKGQVREPDVPETLNATTFLSRQDWVNRQYMQEEAQHCQTLTFDAGIEFIETNRAEDQWFVQIETFDPHEPFFSYDEYRRLLGVDTEAPVFDWPSYRRVVESTEEVERARGEYLSLLAMCDRSLGRVLDLFDRHGLWEDTMLIVCTDHGFLLGERGWWGKSVQPWFNETIHTPLFVWDPRERAAGVRRDDLVQTIDIAPTLLDYFGVDAPEDMQGLSLAGGQQRAGALFGAHGGHVNVTDGRYVYMRACADPSNSPLYNYTLMPTHMRGRFTPTELQDAQLHPPLPFTKDAPVLRVECPSVGNPWWHGSLLFDLTDDPHQQNPLQDEELELQLAGLMVDLMRANDAPPEQYERLGLPLEGPVLAEHLLIKDQWEQVQRALQPSARREDLKPDSPLRTLSLAELLDRHPDVLPDHIAAGLDGMRRLNPTAPLLEVFAAHPGVTVEMMHEIDQALRKVS
ncbi:arylsulfatase A-like enzyme [Kribbella aluminosa]|uniref:Arylsulfatase A-like enzyme n=1 Tax=Kribbella aluminosa TaxID=416017 RepID=A0ABS4UKD9_9ACTN|nr:sulfatase [Kribbella aluminosa]MBP2352108.1 arylsulfatase A-like enzyme [Kribbella aluminosa]